MSGSHSGSTFHAKEKGPGADRTGEPAPALTSVAAVVAALSTADASVHTQQSDAGGCSVCVLCKWLRVYVYEKDGRGRKETVASLKSRTLSQSMQKYHSRHTAAPQPSAVDKQLGLLRAVVDSRGSGGGVGSSDNKGGSPPGSPRTNNRGGEGEKAADGSPRNRLSGSERPKLDHKLRPLQISRPAAPLLVFSSDLAESYKMVTQVSRQGRVARSVCDAGKRREISHSCVH